MAMETRRLTFTEQTSRNANFRGRDKALEVYGPRSFDTRAVEVLKNLPALLAAKQVVIKCYTPLGLEINPAALLGKSLEEIDAMTAKIDALSQAAVARKPQMAEDIESIQQTTAANKPKIEIPEMINHPELPFRVMKSVFAEVSLQEGRERAQELNRQNPGRKFRVPTEAELLKLNQVFKDQHHEVEGRNCLEGRKYWIWTETEHEDYPGRNILHRLDGGSRGSDVPTDPYHNRAIRLIEDK